VISVVLTRRELVNSRETVYTGGNEINMLDSKPESGCDHESAKGSDPCHSVAAICEKTGLSYVNASRVIKRLSDLGFLGVIKGPPHFYRLKEELPLFVECKLAKGK
jgi:hypothetical protein